MIYIIIPVFNRWSFTRACLASLMHQDYQKYKVIIVDHGSTDGTSDKIAIEFPKVVVLSGDETMWWSAATNIGVKFAIKQDAEYILTLNNDTIADPDYLSELINAVLQAPQNALVGSTGINADTKEVNYRGEVLNWFSETSISLLDTVKKRPENGLLSVSHFPGRGILIPTRVYQSIGLYDEINFPHYMADYDFTLRAVENGFKIFCAWDAKIATYPEASSANQLKVNKSINGYKQHLFGIRGGANLPFFYKYVFRHCPPLAMPTHLLLGTARRLIGYWL